MTARRLPFRVFAGLAGLAAASLLLALGWPVMKTWYYVFAWWPFILIVDGLNLRRDGTSPLDAAPAEFLFSAFVSVSVWLVFELFNLRLGNWSYHSLPEVRFERWLGYAVAFATVLPALEELAALFRGVSRRAPRVRLSLRLGRAAEPGLVALGLASLGLALAWPRLFFPLVWLGFIPLLEPLLLRLDAPSLFRIRAGEDRPGRAWVWLAAGLAAGLVWELLNWWAGAHWEYTIPYLGSPRLFQMPLAGFLGFPPFALEAFAFLALLRAVRDRARRRPALLVLGALALIAFDLAAFALIDRFSLIK